MHPSSTTYSETFAKAAHHLPMWSSAAAAVALIMLAAEVPAARAGAPAPTATALHDPECLTVTQSSPATYVIANATCTDQSVLASIELTDGASHARCFTKKIRSQISIASPDAAPIINFQCIEGAPGCSVEILRGMFPECHAG